MDEYKCFLTKKKTEINEIIRNYFNIIDETIKKDVEEIDKYHLAAVLMAITENFEILTDKNNWMSNINLIMLQLKKFIEEGQFSFNLGIVGGLAEIDLAVYNVAQTIGAYANFSKAIHEELLHRTKIFISYCISNLENITVQHYDLIFGVTGIGESILFRDKLSIEDEKVLKDILYYLSLLGWKITRDNVSLPRFYIKSENQMRDDEKRDFPNGNLNFGLAHGMIGPMILLAKAYKRGYEVHNQLNTIYSIYSLYKEFMLEDKGVMHWPTQLSIEKYLNREKRDDYRIRRASWCYGTAGISRGLYLVGKYINDEEIKKIGERSLCGLLNLEFDEYSLNSPIVCHGYAGLVNILFLMYQEDKNVDYLKVVNQLIYKIVDCYEKKSKYGFILNDEMIKPNGETAIVRSEGLDILEGTTGVIITLLGLGKERTIIQEQLLMR